MIDFIQTPEINLLETFSEKQLKDTYFVDIDERGGALLGPIAYMNISQFLECIEGGCPVVYEEDKDEDL